MTDLRRAFEAMTTAGLHLERAESAVPSYSVEALTFVKAELGVCRRRLLNLRRVLGDVDHQTQSEPVGLGPLEGSGAERPGGPDPLPSPPALLGGSNDATAPKG